MATSAPSFLNLGQLLGPRLAVVMEMLYQLKCEIRFAIPGIIQDFDEDAQTATVQIAIQEDMLQNGTPTPVNIKPLPNVPVASFRGGGFSVTLPVQAGDEGLLVFADMCIDSWWQSGGTANRQLERRRHDLSDGFFLPCFWSQPRKLTNYSTDSLQIRSDDGDVVISVEEDEVTITPDAGTTMMMIQPGQITLTATNVAITGRLTVDGDSTINGHDFDTHVHSGVSTGGGTSGPPT